MSTVLFNEPGSSWWPVLWGPVFVAAGAGLEATAGGPVHTLAWVLVGIALAGGAAIWVHARRRVLSVRLTRTELVQGQESLEVRRISEVGGGEEDEDGDGLGTPAGARVLGGGWSVPRKFTDIPVRLDDGSVVLAWARDGEGLRSALRQCVE